MLKRVVKAKKGRAKTRPASVKVTYLRSTLKQGIPRLRQVYQGSKDGMLRRAYELLARELPEFSYLTTDEKLRQIGYIFGALRKYEI